MSQDYSNKELIISYPTNDKVSKFFVTKILNKKQVTIKLLERRIEDTLGKARNDAIAYCNGEFFCTWDDDDWYHMRRLSHQIKPLISNKESFQASILDQLILYNSITKQSYRSFVYKWDNTLMCRKDIFFVHPYADKDVGEDSTVVDSLESRKVLFYISNAPHLYIYIFHHSNTSQTHHFKYFFSRSELLKNSEFIDNILL